MYLSSFLNENKSPVILSLPLGDLGFSYEKKGFGFSCLLLARISQSHSIKLIRCFLRQHDRPAN